MRYQHDCDQCKPLGEFNEFDLYFCDSQLGNIPTVIARYGDSGEQNFSGIGSSSPQLVEAEKRAKKKGYME